MRLGNNNIEDPNICPHCHVVNEPEYKYSVQTTDLNNNQQIITVWRCTNKECLRHFTALYQRDSQDLNSYSFFRFLDGLPKGPNWPTPILNLKSGRNEDMLNQSTSRFIKTYLQSIVAESNGLDELAGMGYRKSIEYLVKDWAIQNNPDNQLKINGLWLSAVISEYYQDDLKGILERATWLGNDQAHYNRLFEEYDIDVLKQLIELIMVELDRQHKMKHYIETIQKRK